MAKIPGKATRATMTGLVIVLAVVVLAALVRQAAPSASRTVAVKAAAARLSADTHPADGTTVGSTTSTAVPASTVAATSVPVPPATGSRPSTTLSTTTAPPKTVPTTSPVGTTGDPSASLHPSEVGLYLVDTTTGVGHLVLGHYTMGDVSFSPDGQRLVFAGRQGDAVPNDTATRLWIIDADGTGLKQVAADALYPEQPQWSPNGRWIAYYSTPLNANGDEGLYLLDPATGVSHLLAWVDQGRSAMEWSPDSTRIAIPSPNHHAVAVVEAASGAVHESPHPGTVYELSWSPDGQHLVASDLTGPVAVTDALGASGRVLSPSGRYARWRPGAQEVSLSINFSAYIAPVNGSAPVLVSTGADPIDWSTDGQFLAAERGDKTVVVIDMATHLEHQVAFSTQLSAGPARWSPAGPVLAIVAEPTGQRRY